MDDKTLVSERRREQNRESQRRFRAKKKQKREKAPLEDETILSQQRSASNVNPSLSVDQLQSKFGRQEHDGSSSTPSITSNCSNSRQLVAASPEICPDLIDTRSIAAAMADPRAQFQSTESVGIHPLLSCGSLTATWHFPTLLETLNSQSVNPVDISRLDQKHCTTALHIATRKGYANIVRRLLDHGVNCNEQDSEGLTPLLHAIDEGHEEIVQLLLDHGALIVPKASLHAKSSALHLAVAHRREDILCTLLAHCAEKNISIDQYDTKGRTPLHQATEENYEPAVIMLLESGAHPDAKMLTG